MSDANVRLIGHASITRHDRGEGTITEILDRYNLSPEETGRVEEFIKIKRPELFPVA